MKYALPIFVIAFALGGLSMIPAEPSTSERFLPAAVRLPSAASAASVVFNWGEGSEIAAADTAR